MPIQVSWHPHLSQVVYLRYGGMLTGRDYIDAVDVMIKLMHETETTVHVLVERTEVVPETPSPLSILFYAQKNFPPNLGYVILIRPSTYARTILTVARSVTPHLVRSVHYVGTYDEALAFLEEKINLDSTDESDV